MNAASEDRSRRLLIFGLGVIGLIIAVSVFLITKGGGPVLLPDLESLPPGAPALAVIEWPPDSGYVGLMLRFDGVIANVGAGPLLVEGNPSGSSATGDPIAQVLLDRSGSIVDRLALSAGSPGSEVQFENSDGHDHWHLMGVAEYSLWSGDEDLQIVAGSKIGFCLADVQPVEDYDGPQTPAVYDAANQCAAGEPDAEFLSMGISAGWADVYSFSIALQWIDVSDVAPGVYRLAGVADPQDVLAESDSENSLVFRPESVVVPGHLAINAQVEVRGSTAFRLSADSFSGEVEVNPEGGQDPPNPVPVAAGAPLFVVLDPPTNGSLNVEVGEEFEAPDIVYTPIAGFVGVDSFTFVAIDPSFDDPRVPKAAVVTLNVQG